MYEDGIVKEHWRAGVEGSRGLHRHPNPYAKGV